MATVAVNLAKVSGQEGLTLYLFAGHAPLVLNGSVLVEIPGTLGRFEAEVPGVDPDTVYRALVLSGDDPVYEGWLADGMVVDRPAGGQSEGAFNVPILATENDRGVPGVLVQLAGSIVSATTNAEGEAVIGVNAGSHVLEVFPPPQYEAVPDLPFTAGQGVTVEITLVRRPAVAAVVPSDLYRVFGEVNVRRWADLDGEGDPSEIEAHILDAIATETDYVLASLARTVSAEDAIQSPMVRDIIARFAGLKVHDNRGYEDAEDGKTDPLQKHRKHADARLKELAIGRVKIKGAKLKGGSAPYVVRDR